MIKFLKLKYSFPISFLIVLVIHSVIFFFFKKEVPFEISFAPTPSKRIDKIDFISKEDLERIKKVGVEHGKKNSHQPDFLKNTAGSILQNKATSAQQANVAPPSHYPPNNEKVISISRSHEVLKQDAMRNLSFNSNSIAAQKISNFEIRYERPEGVTEDELNSDEKAFYSFYKRSYSSYVSKLYSTYEQLAVSHPRINKEFENKHLLVGRIDYDENGNIIMVKILKSSLSDDIHLFFEETLKKLVLPNPPKIFLKRKKEFSIYYQVQIN